MVNIAVIAQAGEITALDLTKDNPLTLTGTKALDYKVFDLCLGLTHDQAWEIIRKNNLILGEKDKSNSSRVYVYSRRNDGSRGEAILYLLWEPDEKRMSGMTVFQGCRSLLSRNFRRLLTFEAFDNDSEFKRKFIGYANRSEITLDVPSLGLKHTTYFYDDIGLNVTRKHAPDGDEVVFQIAKPKL